MASVKKVTVHGNVRWQVRWRDAEGKPCKRNFENAGAAKAHRAEVENDLNAGTYIDQRAGKVTFAAYAEAWRAAQPHSHNTAARVRSEFGQHILPALGHRPLVAVRPTEVQAFATRLGERLAPGSVKTTFSTVAAIFAAAVRDRKIPFDPCDGVKLPGRAEIAVEVNPDELLTVERVDALIDALPAHYRTIAVVAAGAGLRQGEVFGLQVRDVSFLRPMTVRVQRQVQGNRICPPKNRKSRTIPVGQWVIDALAAHLAAYPAKGEEFIFRTPRGGRHVRRAAYAPAWERARDAVGLPTAGMHDLRHHYASALIRSGLDAKVVAERLGHANPAMTWRVYVHLWPDNEDRSRDAIDELRKDRAG